MRDGCIYIAGIAGSRNGRPIIAKRFVRMEEIAFGASGKGKKQQHGKCLRSKAAPHNPKSSLLPDVHLLFTNLRKALEQQ
jgi:hypothetical protein